MADASVAEETSVYKDDRSVGKCEEYNVEILKKEDILKCEEVPYDTDHHFGKENVAKLERVLRKVLVIVASVTEPVVYTA